MKNSPIFVALGDNQLLIELFTRSSGKMKIIQTKYVPRKDEGKGLSKEAIEMMGNGKSDLQIQLAMIHALTSPDWELYVIDRPNITDEDYGVYKYVAKHSETKLQVVNIVSENTISFEKDKRKLIFIDGSQSEELIGLLTKGTPKHTIISSQTIFGENSIDDLNEEDIRGRYHIAFFDALTNRSMELIIVDLSVLSSNKEFWKRYGTYYSCIVQTITLSTDAPKEIRKNEIRSNDVAEKGPTFFEKKFPGLMKKLEEFFPKKESHEPA